VTQLPPGAGISGGDNEEGDSNLIKFRMELDLRRLEMEKASDRELEQMALEREAELARIDSQIRDRFREDARHRSDQAFTLARMGLLTGAAITLTIAVVALLIIAFSSSDAAKCAAAVVASIDLAAIAATFVYGSRGIVVKNEKKEPPVDGQE
jgi:hypothetical protein